MAAHRAGDEETAKRLSQEKERAKKIKRCIFPGCGERCHGLRCKVHYITHRFYARALQCSAAVSAAFCLCALPAFAGSLRLAWDASPTPGVEYLLYVQSDTAPFTYTNYAARVNVGTNLTAHVYQIQPGKWNFAVTAVTNSVESDFSNVLPVEVPGPPTNARTVTLQYNASVTSTNWTDVTVFRVRIE